MFKFKLFLYLLFSTCAVSAAENNSPASLKLRMELISQDLYSIFFCVPKSNFYTYTSMPPLLSFGSGERKDIEVFIARGNESDSFIQYDFIFNKSLMDKKNNIYIRFPFEPLQKNGQKLTLYYDMKNIMAEVEVFNDASDAPCSSARPVAPTRLGGAEVNVIL